MIGTSWDAHRTTSSLGRTLEGGGAPLSRSGHQDIHKTEINRFWFKKTIRTISCKSFSSLKPLFPMATRNACAVSGHPIVRHTLAGGYLAGTRVRSHRTLESPAGTSIPAGCSGAARSSTGRPSGDPRSPWVVYHHVQ